MSTIVKPYTFSAGATIIASEHNSNWDTLLTDYNGNITNSNISASASIVYSKLSLASSIVNADISSSAAIVASKLDLTSPGAIGSVSKNSGAFTIFTFGTTRQGDLIVDNGGAALVRLAAGTSGLFLKSQGSGANLTYGTPPDINTSNCLFQYSAVTSNSVSLGTGIGEIIGSSLSPTTGGTYRFLQGRATQNTYTAVWQCQWIKFAGVSTITVYGEIWTTGSNSANLKVDVGSTSGNVTGTVAQTTPEWKNFTIDVSSLSNGVAYTVTASIEQVASAGTQSVYLGNLIAFGS